MYRNCALGRRQGWWFVVFVVHFARSFSVELRNSVGSAAPPAKSSLFFGEYVYRCNGIDWRSGRRRFGTPTSPHLGLQHNSVRLRAAGLVVRRKEASIGREKDTQKKWSAFRIGGTFFSSSSWPCLVHKEAVATADSSLETQRTDLKGLRPWLLHMAGNSGKGPWLAHHGFDGIRFSACLATLKFSMLTFSM